MEMMAGALRIKKLYGTSAKRLYIVLRRWWIACRIALCDAPSWKGLI
jgi:hypothetical protein